MTMIKLSGIHKVRFKLASGKMAEYHRLGRGKGAVTFWKSTDGTPEGGVDYTAAYHEAVGAGKAHVEKFRAILKDFLESPEFKKKAPRTQRDYRDSIDHQNGIDTTFGDFPAPAFNDPRIRKKVINWRNKRWGVTRQADMKVGHLSSIVTWAINNGRLLSHHLQRIPKVYKSDRSDIIWTDEEIKKFCSPAVPRYAQRVLITVAETGLAPVDAVRLRRSEHVLETPEGRRIQIKRGKTKVVASMPVTDMMAEILDEMPDDQDLVLVTERGAPWGHENQLGSLVSKWRNEMGIRKELHLYDARGTAATRLLNAGLEINEIALGMGWSVETAARMIKTYAKVNPEITDSMLRKIKLATSAT